MVKKLYMFHREQLSELLFSFLTKYCSIKDLLNRPSFLLLCSFLFKHYTLFLIKTQILREKNILGRHLSLLYMFFTIIIIYLYSNAELEDLWMRLPTPTNWICSPPLSRTVHLRKYILSIHLCFDLTYLLIFNVRQICRASYLIYINLTLMLRGSDVKANKLFWAW